jgi:hypothetical protein
MDGKLLSQFFFEESVNVYENSKLTAIARLVQVIVFL